MITAKKLEEAIEFAVTAHKGQFRKGDKRPYIMHPISVMNRVATTKQSSNAYLLAAAAVLHDTVEDCDVNIHQIANRFGFYVAALVEELTLDKDQYDKLGKTVYLQQELTKMSSYALCIKLCDRLDNVEDMQSMPQDFVDRYKKETLDILDYVIRNRKKLSSTHKLLIEQIYEALEKY